MDINEERMDKLKNNLSILDILNIQYLRSDASTYNTKIYYDRIINKPIVSNSFPRYSTTFGARLRLSLNQ